MSLCNMSVSGCVCMGVCFYISLCDSIQIQIQIKVEECYSSQKVSKP